MTSKMKLEEIEERQKRHEQLDQSLLDLILKHASVETIHQSIKVPHNLLRHALYRLQKNNRIPEGISTDYIEQWKETEITTKNKTSEMGSRKEAIQAYIKQNRAARNIDIAKIFGVSASYVSSLRKEVYGLATRTYTKRAKKITMEGSETLGSVPKDTSAQLMRFNECIAKSRSKRFSESALDTLSSIVLENSFFVTEQYLQDVLKAFLRSDIPTKGIAFLNKCLEQYYNEPKLVMLLEQFKDKFMYDLKLKRAIPLIKSGKSLDVVHDITGVRMVDLINMRRQILDDS